MRTGLNGVVWTDFADVVGVVFVKIAAFKLSESNVTFSGHKKRIIKAPLNVD